MVQLEPSGINDGTTVLIINSTKKNTISIHVGGPIITSKSGDDDAKINFKVHLEASTYRKYLYQFGLDDSPFLNVVAHLRPQSSV